VFHVTGFRRVLFRSVRCLPHPARQRAPLQCSRAERLRGVPPPGLRPRAHGHRLPDHVHGLPQRPDLARRDGRPRPVLPDLLGRAPGRLEQGSGLPPGAGRLPHVPLPDLPPPRRDGRRARGRAGLRVRERAVPGVPPARGEAVIGVGRAAHVRACRAALPRLCGALAGAARCVCAGAALLLALAAAAAPVAAQDAAPRVRARVTYIAGSNVYVDAGSEQGIRAQDTLAVFREADGARLGAVVVLSVTDARAVATFAGRPFTLTRGTALLLELPRHGAPATADSAAAAE